MRIVYLGAAVISFVTAGGFFERGDLGRAMVGVLLRAADRSDPKPRIVLKGGDK